MKLTRKPSGFTLIELLVVISIIAILASLSIPAVTGALVKGQMIQTMNNVHQLQLATQTMALDAVSAGDTAGWPDPTGTVRTFDNWTTELTNGNYLSVQELRKLLSAPNFTVPAATAPSGANSALFLYPVGQFEDSSLVFLSTKNWNASTHTALDSTTKPYGNKGYVLVRKGGDSQVLTSKNATNADLLSTNQAAVAPLN